MKRRSRRVATAVTIDESDKVEVAGGASDGGSPSEVGGDGEAGGGWESTPTTAVAEVAAVASASSGSRGGKQKSVSDGKSDGDDISEPEQELESSSGSGGAAQEEEEEEEEMEDVGTEAAKSRPVRATRRAQQALGKPRAARGSSRTRGATVKYADDGDDEVWQEPLRNSC